MSHHVIDRQDWPAFMDGFSRRHGSWLVSVALEGNGAVRRYLTRDSPLHGVVAELSESDASVMIFTGTAPPHATHFVEHPVSLSVEETDEGAEAELTVTDSSGLRTVVEFRSPMLIETVDGEAP